MKVLKALSQKLIDFQSKIILFLVYVFVLPIFFLIFKLKQKNEQVLSSVHLRSKMRSILAQNKAKSSWQQWSLKSDTLEDLNRQS